VANLPLVSTTPAVNFPTGTAGVVHTSGKFAARVNEKFIYMLTLLPQGVQTK
jgi:hypothetical protein